jgi:cell wall-associated NlpC family hydrolase
VSSRSGRAWGRVPGKIVAVLALACTAGTVVAGIATPAMATPTPAPQPAPVVAGKTVDPKLNNRIATVTAQLAALAKQNDRLDERYDVAEAVAAAQQRAAAQAQQVAEQATAKYDAAHRAFVEAVTSQYEGGASATVGALLASAQPGTYLNNLEVAGYLSNQFAATVHNVRATRAVAAAAARRAIRLLNAARVKQQNVARQRDALVKQQRTMQHLLASLTARQQHEIAHARAVAAAQARAELLAMTATATKGQSPGSYPPGQVSAAVQRVIAYAEARVGHPYVFGAAGPTAYDCSGLVMAAYAQAGVALPHSAAEQYHYGTHVAYGQLRPGDLIFLYSPIEHVELYVGNDLAVSAADPALGIIYVHPSDDLADYAGATRLLG